MRTIFLSGQIVMTKLRRWGVIPASVATGCVLLLVLLGRPSRRPKLPVGQVPPAVCLGATHGLILASDGSLWSWGADFFGSPVLGLGDVTSATCLRRIGGDSDWLNISAGENHNLSVKSDGTFWAWGANSHGQLGDCSSALSRNKPAPSAPGNAWKQAAAGGYFSLGLKQDGTLWSWGDNWAGQLGIGSTARSRQPLQVGSATNWVKVWAGITRAAGLQSDGSLWIWGNHPPPSSELAKSNKFLMLPTRLSPETDWRDVAFGPEVLLALKSNGTLWAAGPRASVFTGITNNTLPFALVPLGTNSDWQSCWASEEARDLWVLLRKRDGSLWVLESTLTAGGSFSLTQIDVHGDFVALAGGGGGGHGAEFSHDGVCTGVVLTRQGEVWTWGRALGHANPSLQGAARLARRFRYDAHWGDPKPIDRDQPWQLPNLAPRSPEPR